jgi:hypothetical protein
MPSLASSRVTAAVPPPSTPGNTPPVTFKMTIRDVFAFTSGATVFTGEVEDAPNFIGPCNCELAVEAVGRRAFE